MATHRQAKKRNRQRIKLQAHHRAFKSGMRTQIKRVRAALAQKGGETAQEALKRAIPTIDRCAQKGLIHRRRASRIISRLTRAATAMANQ